MGHLLENIVFNELNSRGYDVQVGKLRDCETDFVASDGRHTAYVQVTFLMDSQKTEITEDCAMYRAMQTISGKWRMVVMYQLSKKDSFRFGELQKALPGITKSMLSAVLKELEENGLVSRR